MNSDTSAASLGFTSEQIALISQRQNAHQAAQSQMKVETAEAEVLAVMGKIRKAHQELDRQREEKAKPTAEKVLSEMEKQGYPGRASDTVQSMHGPSLQKAKELEPLIMAGDSILVIYGDRGPGKTQMGAYWGFRRGMAGMSIGRYIKTFDLLAEIKKSWEQKSRTSEDDVLRRYRVTPFLILDEFQERSESDWDNRTLVNILDHRYDKKLVTVLIANLGRLELDSRIPASIISRAEEVGGLVHCNWPSYRSKH